MAPIRELRENQEQRNDSIAAPRSAPASQEPNQCSELDGARGGWVGGGSCLRKQSAGINRNDGDDLEPRGAAREAEE